MTHGRPMRLSRTLLSRTLFPSLLTNSHRATSSQSPLNMWDIAIWIFAIIFCAFFIFSVVFTMISCSDLENGYIGPIDMVQRLNQIVLFEVGFHAFITGIYLFSFNVWEFVANLPLAAYNIWLVFNQKHLLDETKILQDDNLAVLRKRELIKLIFFVATFFWYLYKASYFASLIAYIIVQLLSLFGSHFGETEDRFISSVDGIV